LWTRLRLRYNRSMAELEENQYSNGLMVALNTLCTSCKHYDPIVNPYICASFPNGIPKPILLGVYDHRFRWLEDGNEDNGITYEPTDKKLPKALRMKQNKNTETE